ncbi:MAG: alpha/beta fold hydrolase [Acidobacteriota bacterium]
MNLAGHLNTVSERLRVFFSPVPEPPARPWSLTVEDPDLGPVLLTGRLSELDSSSLVVILHGLGGCSESHYARRAAQQILASGVACLRLNLRGSDRLGEDFYHAGLTTDLHQVLASRELAFYDQIYVLGFSLGGHVALRAATEASDERWRSVAAVCAPLDLAPCARLLDRPSAIVYRTYLLNGLKDIYGAVATRRPVPLELAEARRIRSLREWDDRVVAPRHGFANGADYYARASVGPRLGGLRRQALLVLAEDDPMVPVAALDERLAAAPAALKVRRLASGGHLGFPRSADLGWPGEGFAAQLLGWLQRSASEAAPQVVATPPEVGS